MCGPWDHDILYCRVNRMEYGDPWITGAVFILRNKTFYKKMFTIAFDSSSRLHKLGRKLSAMVVDDFSE